MGERFGMSVLHGYNGEIFSTALLVVKITNLSKFFWMGEILRGSVLHGYNERAFFCSQLPVKFSKLYHFSLGGVSFSGLSATDI